MFGLTSSLRSHHRDQIDLVTSRAVLDMKDALGQHEPIPSALVADAWDPSCLAASSGRPESLENLCATRREGHLDERHPVAGMNEDRLDSAEEVADHFDAV